MEHLPPRGFGDLPTRGDLDLLRAATKSDIDALRAEFGGLRAEFGGLRSEFGSRMEALEHKLTGQMERGFRRILQWMTSTVLVGIGLAIAAARLI